MTITVELPKDIDELYLAQARARGITIGAYVHERLTQTAPSASRPPTLSAEEVNRVLDEAADLVPAGIPPLSDRAMSRESIYTREDEW